MPLFSSHQAETKDQQSNTTAAAQQPAFQAVPHHQSKSKAKTAAAMKVILPIHFITPKKAYAKKKCRMQTKKDLPKNSKGPLKALDATGQSWSRGTKDVILFLNKTVTFY